MVHRKHDNNFVCRLTLLAVICPLSANSVANPNSCELVKVNRKPVIKSGIQFRLGLLVYGLLLPQFD